MKFVGVAVLGVCALLAICAGIAGATVGGGATIANAPVVHRRRSGGQATPRRSLISVGTSTSSGCCSSARRPREDHVGLARSGRHARAVARGNERREQRRRLLLRRRHRLTGRPAPFLTDTNSTGGDARRANGRDRRTGTIRSSSSTRPARATPAPTPSRRCAARSVRFRSRTSRRSPGQGTFRAAVNAPDGGSISDSRLKLTLNGYWSNRAHKLATATPVGGHVPFDYSLPPSLWGKKIRLGISGGGSSYYQAVTSEKESVKVLVPHGPVRVCVGRAEDRLETSPAADLLGRRRKGYRLEFWHLANGITLFAISRAESARDPSGEVLIVGTYPCARGLRRR